MPTQGGTASHARISGCVALVLISLTSACGTTSRLEAPPQEIAANAVLPGFSNIRYFVPTDSELMRVEYDRSVERELKLSGKRTPRQLPAARFLALSGGADDGAFGAGLLEG